MASVRAAREAGAYRVELCRDLPLDGLTPDEVAISEAVAEGGPRVNVLIRPGDSGCVCEISMFVIMTNSTIT